MRENRSALYGTCEKEIFFFFFFGRYTHKEINWGFSRRGFGCYNHRELKYSRDILLRYWFYWVPVFCVVRLYLFLENDFLIYCELKFGHKLEYCNLYFIIVD